MELSGILFLVVVLVLFILFVFGLVKAYAGWGIFYTLTLILLFLSTLGFLYASACVADRRIRWVRIHDQMKKKLADLEVEANKLKFGNINDPTTSLDSLLGLANELNRTTLERGRVWRNAALGEAKPNSISLTLSAEPATNIENPAGDAAAAPAPAVNGELPAEAIVYGFAEASAQDGRIIPKTYLGEFFVAESQGGKVTLTPISPLLKPQADAIKSGAAATWTLFEIMPLDSHVAFAEPGSKRTNEQEFGRMDRQVLADLFQIPVDLLDRDPSQLSPEENLRYQILRSYVLDGGRAPENEPPENVWSRVEFLVEHKVDVDDLKSERKATDGGYFDFSGRAVDARLKRQDGKGEVTFLKGQQALIASKPAKTLVDDNIAKLIEPIFVRPINDYALAFKEKRDQITQLGQDIATVNREIKTAENTNSRLQGQVVFRQNERTLLDADYGQYQKEQTVIRDEVSRLTKAVQDSKAELSRLYQLALQHYERLVTTQRAIYQAAGN
jgi:hypothetical protein